LRKRAITPFGWEIKKRLAELHMDQRSFCQKYNIPEYRLSNLITGARKAERYRQEVARLLEIDVRDFENDRDDAQNDGKER